jgi:putative ABC transport system substrate-binding protein
MKRREFIGLLGGAMIARPFEIHAQQVSKIHQIGYLAGGRADHPMPKVFVQALHDLGYAEGKNFSIQWRFAAGRMEHLPEMAAELASLNVDVIVAATSLAALPAKEATKTIPIVVIASHDGVGTGLFASLARPGGNLTGVESLAPSLDVKRVEMLRGILPQLSRLAIVYNPLDPGGATHFSNAKDAAGVVAATVRAVEVRSSSEFDDAFGMILRDRPDAVLVVADALTFLERKRIVDFATKHALPTAYEFKEFTQLGGLISYGPSQSAMWQRGAHYVDRILKGEKPSDLPVEQPTKFELFINMKTAQALGLTIPANLLALADGLIE